MSADFTITTPCRMCGAAAVPTALDLSSAAVCSDYPTAPGRSVPRCRFRLGACPQCGLLQLQDTPPLEWLRPPVEAVKFREPERHLDDLCRVVAEQLSGRDGLVIGFTSKDRSFLERLQQAGFARTRLLDRVADWGLTSPRDGLETMQQQVSPAWAARIRAQYGPALLLCVRHLLEHAHDLPTFLAGCRDLVAPGGWMLFETPSCETEFARGDVGALWEEHIAYFTPSTLRRGLELHGVACRWVGSYPYAVEDNLVVLGQALEPAERVGPADDGGSALLQELAAGRERLRNRLAACAAAAASEGRRLALWGAGHRTATFVQLLPARDLVDCVIDDDPHKQGRFLPGSDLPILPPAALLERSIGVCVGMLGPEALRQIAARNSAFVANGGRLLTLADVAAGAVGRPA